MNPEENLSAAAAALRANPCDDTLAALGAAFAAIPLHNDDFAYALRSSVEMVRVRRGDLEIMLGRLSVEDMEAALDVALLEPYPGARFLAAIEHYKDSLHGVRPTVIAYAGFAGRSLEHLESALRTLLGKLSGYRTLARRSYGAGLDAADEVREAHARLHLLTRQAVCEAPAVRAHAILQQYAVL